jgi:hypothetical protein
MNEVFVPASTAKRRLAEIALAVGLGLVGLIATSMFNSVLVSATGGAVTGLLLSVFGSRLWPISGEVSDRRQWILFYAFVVIPCGLVSGVLLIYELLQHNLRGTYIAALMLSCVLYAPVHVGRAARREAE